ncbi:hypothetical protein [Rhodospira trueperi]|uniref:DUF4189 domain-containing protein n=1 Tax=Rhodospira trueperi TaxID=69960 RepID=A0A1G7G418_9PROT|nr:hypothetical protein [Rhodospira trueperi]SDE82837.1 hypothetical protein SAMN05421720_11372 [Rhodospira trueperi]
MRNLKWAALLCGLVTMSGPAAAAQGTESCNVVGVYGTIALVVCPDADTDAEFIAAGQEACQSIAVRNVCNAWIWRSQDRAARVLPMENHQLDSVTALWINRQGQLKVCARDGCYAGQR